MARGVVVVASLRAGLSIATGPDAQVNGEDRWIIAGRVPRQQHLQGLHVESPFGQGIIETAPPTAVCRLQAQMW
jgi:hypothetical protein